MGEMTDKCAECGHQRKWHRVTVCCVGYRSKYGPYRWCKCQSFKVLVSEPVGGAALEGEGRDG